MNAQEYRERTAKELGLAGNHPDAIAKHLDAYEAALAHDLAETATPEEAHPARERWLIETWEGGMWMLASGFHTDRAKAEADLQAKRAKAARWADGEPVRRRLVCERMTYTVVQEAEAR